MIPALPELDRAWTLLGRGEAAQARDIAAEILTRFPDNVSALACHAMANWQADGDMALSMAEIERALAAAPGLAAIRHNYATLLSSQGRTAEATAQFREALRLQPDDAVAFQGLTQNVKFKEEDDLVRRMVALHAQKSLDPARQEYLAFALAKIFDDLNVPERAIAYAIEANVLGARPFNLSGEAATLDELKELGRLDAFRRVRGGGHPTRAPIFIVGMPRAGTTLVEAILARHPDVLALGESSLILGVEIDAYKKRGPGRQVLRHELTIGLDRGWLGAQAEGLVQLWNRKAGRPVTVVTDKVPENAVRLGLVQRLFPNARVIHVRRHPLDTGVSNFFQRFTAAGQGFSTRLDWIGTRTRQTADAMVVWKRALDLPFLDVSYERLVTEPETQARRIAEFAGLAWTDALLEPDRAPRAILTASVWQVRQPIYTTAVARWKRYEPWLAPMIAAMGGMEWIEREVAEIAAAG